MAIMVVNLAAGFPLSLFSSYVSAHEKFTFQRVMELLRVVINPMIMLPLLLLGYKSIAMAVVMTALTLLNGVAVFITALKSCICASGLGS